MKLISDRYSILNKLGQGGSGITYAAVDKKTGEQVAIKALSLTGLDDWKKIELFEREAKILQQLNHPAIPKYIDYFQVETASEVYFYIVQELAPGQSLAHLISQGWQPDEQTVKDLAQRVLEILVYLQQLTPPVIHRDIKPNNIIYQPDTGKLFLVDFGAVQDTYHHTVMGSTVVGTYGYMSPEQFRGGATLSTDLYGLGSTLLFLLTGKSPAELPQKKLKIKFRNTVQIEPSFANWIDKLIEPNVKQRFPKAEAALLVLQEKKSLKDFHYELIVKPRYSSIKIGQIDEQLIIDIPPPYQRKRVNSVFYFWAGWGVLSMLNRLAILVSVFWLGKIYLIIWFANIFLTTKKDSGYKLFEYLLLLLFVLAIASGNILSIPSFSLALIAIDFVLELFFKHNFIQQLLFTTQILFEGDRLTVAKKVIQHWHQESFRYKAVKISLPKVFLTSQETAWLQAEIEEFRASLSNHCLQSEKL
ncbi:serine/threonine protein kinase [Pleurocapsales cyanobacterium LEGE 10410]|nr:serine/threonine protein kinase [Pleurocapsales cyanobacterium LEGE 10410]